MGTRLKWPIVRDIAQWVIGTGIIVQQVFLAKAVSWELLVVAMVLMGLPGVTGLLHLKPDGKPEIQTGPEQPSVSQRS